MPSIGGGGEIELAPDFSPVERKDCPVVPVLDSFHGLASGLESLSRCAREYQGRDDGRFDGGVRLIAEFVEALRQPNSITTSSAVHVLDGLCGSRRIAGRYVGMSTRAFVEVASECRRCLLVIGLLSA